MGEFELIQKYFTRPTPRAVLGVGDDCALLQPAAGMQLAISSDMLVSGRHFFADVDPRTLGHKALAVNLSDLAACGARPLAFTLALSLPTADPAWLQPFSEGLLALADSHGCELIGGDTTSGPLNICITVFGEVPAGQALLRSAACDGDDIYVSGTIGDARFALEHLLGRMHMPQPALEAARLRLEMPIPRLELGMALRGIARACADVSDGLAGDLGHILERSGLGAVLFEPALRSLAQTAPSEIPLAPDALLELICNGGDDYELVFTADPGRRDAVLAASRLSATPVSRIGRMRAAPGLEVVDAAGYVKPVNRASFDHFRT